MTWTNEVTETLTLVSIRDDKFGNLDAAGNGLVEDNKCRGFVGTALAGGATATCTFTARVEGTAGDEHVNVVTIVAQDDDTSPAAAARFKPGANTASSSASATVTVVAAASLPATDMLSPSSTTSAAEIGGSDERPLWILWVSLAAAVILGAGWVIRRQRRAFD